MAKKSIADQILKDLKTERKENIKKSKETCLDFMQSLFAKRLENLEEWKEDFFYIYSRSILPPEVPILSFISFVNSFGFKTDYNEQTISFSVPAREKGKKITKAQSMLYNFKLALNKKLKESKQLAITERDRVWISIKNRDFSTTDNDDGTFTISLPLSKERGGKNGDRELLKFLSLRAFPNATIKDNILSIVLG